MDIFVDCCFSHFYPQALDWFWLFSKAVDVNFSFFNWLIFSFFGHFRTHRWVIIITFVPRSFGFSHLNLVKVGQIILFLDLKNLRVPYVLLFHRVIILLMDYNLVLHIKRYLNDCFMRAWPHTDWKVSILLGFYSILQQLLILFFLLLLHVRMIFSLF